jgi:hypothetical protein
MITSIPFLLFIPSIPLILTWIKFSSTFILFGLYYGFLTTLPIGPSQILAIRAFLLEGNFGGTVAISGSIMGQLLIFLSVYYSPFYIILIKPHLLSLLLLYYIFFYWYRIKDLLSYQSLRPITSLRDFRVYHIFFDSMIFQLLNPVLLPSPILARLLNIFFFRYSNNILFLTSTLLGWFFGQYLFIYSSKILLFRIESDSPILYLLVKRIIHRIFSIIILSLSLLHLGRIPVPFITKRIIEKFQLTFSKREDLLFSQKVWPNLFFDYRQWKRPLRYIANSRFSTQSPVKKRVSQYFFNSSISDGKPRLSFTDLPTVAIFEKSFNKDFNSPTYNAVFENWRKSNEKNRESLYNEFHDRIKFFYSGFNITEVLERKIALSNFKDKIFTKSYDPILTQGYETINLTKSSWLVNDQYTKLKKTQKHPVFLERTNKLKDWISKQWKELEYKNFVLPWEPITRDARRILGLLINKSKKGNFGQNSKQINFFDAETKIEPNETNNFSILNVRKKFNRKPNLSWEFVLNLSPRQKALYFNYLETDQSSILKNYWKTFSFGDIVRIKNFSSRIDKKFLFRELNKEIPRWTPDLKNDKFDVIAIGITDIRQRKVKNLGYLIKGKDKRRKIVRRFSQQSDFRRKLVKGSMRARRRKTLIWKMFQLKINSPFFLRIIEKPFFLINNSYGHWRNLPESELIVENNFKKKNEKFSFSGKTKADRLAIANRWDFPLAQWGRSWLLIIQSHVRKYCLLPLLIILKNISRLFLFQTPEWNEDWSEWSKEIHIRCTYDGTEVSEKELPEQWLRDGLQIKIIYPFHLKPWYSNKSRIESLKKNTENLSKLIKKRRFHYCYLSAWGFLTDLPFGNIKKQRSFWKPINKELSKKWKKNIFHSFFIQVNKKSLRTSNNSKLDLESNKKYEKSINNTQVFLVKNHNLVLEKDENSEYEKINYIRNLENLLSKKTKQKIFFQNTEEKNYFVDKNTTKRKLVKKLIEFKQNNIRFFKRNIKLIKNSFSNLKINIRKIEMNYRIKTEIIKELIKNKIKT